MAVRFSTDGESYTRSTGLTTVSTWSVACWVMLADDRAATTVLWQVDNGSGTNRLRINAWNGTALTFQSSSGGWFANIGHALDVGEWTYVGFSATNNPGQARVAVRTAGSNLFVGGSSSQTNITINANTLRIGDGQEGGAWLDGSLAAVKVWNQALSVEELQQESWTYQPIRTDGLRGWYPLLTPSTADLSGSGQTLSGGSGTATEHGPPISWSAGRRTIILPPASGIAGGLNADLPALAASTTGAVEVSGQTAGTLPAATATASGTVQTEGALTAPLPALTASLAGETDLPAGQMAVTLPALTGDLSGEATATGVLDATLPALVGSFTDLKSGDFDFIATGLSRGWTSRALQPAWAGLNVAAAWTARGLSRGWVEDDIDRAWNAHAPTL